MKQFARRHCVSLISWALVGLLCSALAAGWANERKDRLIQIEALESHIIEMRASHRAAVYGLVYALRSEQAKAGSFEAQRNDVRTALGNNKGYVDNLLTQIASLEVMLGQCHATNTMLVSDSWTGQASIQPGEQP